MLAQIVEEDTLSTSKQEHPREDRSRRTIRRIVVFTGSEDRPSTAESIEALTRAMPDTPLLVVVGTVQVRRRRWIRTRLRRLRREPVSYPLQVLIRGLSALVRRNQEPIRTSVVPPSLDGNGAVNLQVKRFGDIHSAACIQEVREFQPSIGVAIGAPILREKLFKIPEFGTINLHKSLLPEYRGMPPGFWELHDGAASAGATIHRVDRGLDRGPILHQRALPIPKFSTWGGLMPMLDELGEAVLIEAIQALQVSGDPERAQEAARTPTRSSPPLLLEWRVRHRLRKRRSNAVDRRRPFRDLLKNVTQFLFVYGFALPRNRWRRATGRCHTTVLLYHRVSDEFLDTVTVGVEQFGQHLKLLRRHYEVVDMRTFLRSQATPQSRPRVVLTFDDGYADNYLAARLIRREGLPCTFFVCTRIVGSEEAAFPHDLKRLNQRVPPLEWDQVRRMKEWGFDFANHTADHVDVASVSLESAISQVRTASTDLVAHLGVTGAENWFAFPYGGRHNITSEVREHLPKIGIEACFSAHGGTNVPTFDRMSILRQGVDYGFSDLALRAAIEGWRVR